MSGLSFDLTEEQEQLRQTVRDFADRECPKDVARRPPRRTATSPRSRKGWAS
ncbi:MAG TPA: hypothetical protein VFW50_18240 [Streptosporangiaceae bacterium]|nr:hypothetical protein [Streptosporangiaceae bacterium]